MYAAVIQPLLASSRNIKSRGPWFYSDLLQTSVAFGLDSAKLYAGHFILSLRFLTSAVFKSFIRYFLYYPDELRSSFYETIAFPLLLPLSLCQDLDPRLGQINSHSRLCGYLLQPSPTSPNDPLSGHSLRFQLPFPPALLPHACAPPPPPTSPGQGSIRVGQVDVSLRSQQRVEVRRHQLLFELSRLLGQHHGGQPLLRIVFFGGSLETRGHTSQ